MADIIKKIRTTSGDSQIDFGSLANKFTINGSVVEANENIMDKIINDKEVSINTTWSGAKINKLAEQIRVILGEDAPSTFAEIRFAVEQGRASEYFNIGDQLKPNWTDGVTNYEDPFDVVQMNRTYELESGATIKGMMIQQHYVNVKDCPFDAQEALYDADEELPAGTYHFTVAGDTWLPSENGKVLQFTLTQTIPAGGQLVFSNQNTQKQELAGQSVSTFASPISFEAIETAVLSEGSAGIDLGITDGSGNLNYFQPSFRGRNRWKTSMLRQYLNSDKPAGEWWVKQNKWDRASSFINTVPGYMAGFETDFLTVVKPVKVQTAVSTVTPYSDGVDTTYDYFFPISLEQMNIVPSVANAEGDSLSYWYEIAKNYSSDVLNNGRFKQFGTYPLIVSNSLADKMSPKNTRIRSAAISDLYSAWFVTPYGYVTFIDSVIVYQTTPACVIG